MLLWLGVAALALAVVGAVAAIHDWTLWNALRRVRPTSPERLVKAAQGGRFDGRVVAVSGIADAGPAGPRRSTVTGEPCVWHRYTVHRRHIRYRSAGGGSSQRYTGRRRVADVVSPEPFVLRPVFPRPATPARAAAGGSGGEAGSRGEAGTAADAPARLRGDDGLPQTPASAGIAVEVVPAGLRVHRPVVSGVRILPALASEPFPAADALMGRAGLLYWHREWVLRPGAPIFVLAEVHTGADAVILRRPAKGPHVVSTRTATWLRRRTAINVILGLFLAVVGSAVGAAALIAHWA